MRRTGGSRLLIAAACLVFGLASVVGAQPTRAPADLRAVHERVVYAIVQVRTWTRLGTGWLLEQDGRPMIVTNRHVVQGRRDFEIRYYQGASRPFVRGRARPSYVANRDEPDLAFLYPQEDPPSTARPLRFASRPVVRGQHVVLGGHPGGLPFQTTEGVVTGHLPPSPRVTRPCGGRNCFVIDAASFAGSSGGPVVNTDGEVMGMLWGGAVAQSSRGGAVQNSSFAFAILGGVLTSTLQGIAARNSERAASPAP